MNWSDLINTLITGLLLIVAGATGAFLTAKTQRALAKESERREDQLRWIRDLRDVAAALVAACHDFEETSLLLHKSGEPGRAPLTDFRRNELYGELIVARRAVLKSSTLLGLLAPENIAAKASDVLELTSELGRKSEGTESDYSQVQVEFGEAVGDLIFLTRDALGVELRRE
jgi:hypothetical protein